MTISRRHSTLTGADVGSIVWKEVVNTAARLALSVTEADNGKIVRQTDTTPASYWVLDDYSGPTWAETTSVGVAAVTSVFGQIGDVDETDASFTAADIANVAAGNIAATDVQAAINELDSEKAALTHTHVLSQITDSGTAAAQNVGVTVGDVPQLEDVGGGTPGLPAVDGSQLTGVAGGGSAITVTDEGGAPLTTDVVSFDFVGSGVTASNVGDDVTITIAAGAAPVDTVFGRTGTVIAVADDYTASQVANVAAGSIAATDVQAAIDELDSEKAASGDARFPTSDEKGALAGTGVPSGVNRYVNDDDTRLSSSVAHVAGDGSDHADVATNTAHSSGNGSDHANVAANTASIAGLGTAANEDVGVGIGDVVQMIDSGGAKLPAVDGSLLTGITASGTIDVEEEGTPVAGGPHDTMNFIGSGVTAADGGGGTVTVTIAAGGAPVDTVFGRTGTVVAVDDDYTASQVANVAAGTIAATDVQAAINELDSEKAANSHTQVYSSIDGVPTDTFLGRDTAGTGASEALSPTVARALLNVQDGSVAAGTSGDAYATSHEADATAHTAAEIVNTPAGSVAATDVQGAINELDTEKSATGHTHTLSDVTDSGTAAPLDVGTAVADIPQLVDVGGGTPGMPAVDGSQLTGLPGGVNQFKDLIDTPASYATHAGESVRVNVGETALEFFSVTGDVVKSGTTADNQLARWDGADTNSVEGSTVTVDDSGNMTIPGTVDGRNVSADGSKLDFITVTQAVDLDTMETDVAANTAKSANIDHTGDVVTSGAAATIQPGVVTYAKMQDVSVTDRLLGRDTAGAGVVEEIAPADVRTMINVADGADVTDTANVTAAGALMDSEVDADIKTLALPANTTISTFGASLVDDANAAEARATLGVATRLRGVCTVNAGGISANTLIEVGTNVTGTLVDYDALTFATDVEAYINGRVMRGGASAAANFDVYPSAVGVERAAGSFYCEFDLAEGDTIQVFAGDVGAPPSSAPTLSKCITVEDPVTAEDITVFFTPVAITITEMRAVVRGTTPSVLWFIKHGTDRSAAGAAVVTAGTTTTSQTTGSDVTSFDDATVAADSFIWLETTTVSGTNDEISITIVYTED